MKKEKEVFERLEALIQWRSKEIDDAA